jgi:hypothetical protein
MYARSISTVIARSEADEAIHLSPSGDVDCFASLAMTIEEALSSYTPFSSIALKSARARCASAFATSDASPNPKYP